MKKYIIISIFLVMILVISTFSFADNNIISVSMNGSSVKVQEVPVLMDGIFLKSEVPSFVYIDRTLVPIRFVAEGLGAKVDWEQKTKTATIMQKDKTIKLTIDSSKVVINNDIHNLDKNSTPKLVTFANKDSRTMVPIRLISEVLGYDVNWDQNNKITSINSKNEDKIIDLNPEINIPTQELIPPTDYGLATITEIKAQKGNSPYNKLIINSDKKLEYETLFLPDTNKLVIDIKNSILSLKNTGENAGEFIVDDINFGKVQYSQYSTAPYSTRIVVNMYEKKEYEIVESNNGKTNILTFGKTIKGINIENINGQDAIVINGIGTSYNILKLKNPERIVIDLLDANLEGVPYANYDYQLGFVKGIRTSQFSGDSNYSSIDRVVRVVLDIKEGVTNPNVTIDTEDNRLIIYPEKSLWESINYIPQGLDKLLTINALNKTKYSVDYENGNKSLIITIPNDNIDLESGFVNVKDNMIESIEVIRSKEDTTIIVKLKRDLEYTVLSDRKDTKVQIYLKRDPNTINTNKIIVIDPGHGGSAPGAISVNGVKEKEINIQISLKLESYLKSLGYTVLMTRTGDQNPGIFERANFANAANADLFVSIHSNSHTNREIKGLQVLYCPQYDSKVKTTDQYPFAQSIFDAVLASTGADDKGIIKRTDLPVIRETVMPAVLVEVGFLSNAEEEILITNDNYQNKIVEGIVTGIQNYIEMY